MIRGYDAWKTRSPDDEEFCGMETGLHMSNREIERNEALARIEGLENELANGWQRDRIAALEEHIEQLEAALRAIVIRCEEGDKSFNWLSTISNIARAALDQSSPPKANT